MTRDTRFLSRIVFLRKKSVPNWRTQSLPRLLLSVLILALCTQLISLSQAPHLSPVWKHKPKGGHLECGHCEYGDTHLERIARCIPLSVEWSVLNAPSVLSGVCPKVASINYHTRLATSIWCSAERAERADKLMMLHMQQSQATTSAALTAHTAMVSTATAAIASTASVAASSAASAAASAAAAAVHSSQGQSSVGIFHLNLSDGSEYHGQVREHTSMYTSPCR